MGAPRLEAKRAVEKMLNDRMSNINVRIAMNRRTFLSLAHEQAALKRERVELGALVAMVRKGLNLEEACQKQNPKV